MKTIAMLAVMAALVVAGVAAAQNESGGSDGNANTNGNSHRPPPGSPPMMGLAMKGLTYAEVHVKGKDGEEVLRIDQGKLTNVADDSITLTENDGSDVTVSVDADTQVIGRPGQDTSIDELETGQQVSVTAAEGEAAKSVMVMPKKGDLAAGFGSGGPSGPPPRMGAPGKLPPLPSTEESGSSRSGN